MAHLALALRCLIGIVFLVSSLSKVVSGRRFQDFADSLRTMDVLPARLVPAAARAVVLAEFAVWVLLVIGPTAGFVLATGLLAAFTLGITSAVRRGVYAPCQCFGTSVRPLGPRHVVRNAVLTAGAAVGASAALVPGEMRPAGAAVAVLAGVCCAGPVLLLDDLLDLFRPMSRSHESVP
ncbi:MauE/DoxX family redox-associated membrane protein [Streptomyces sp. NPDC048290]|uniref:MauE/DoxX family redox-associated membrane protein n=1 Tax=Streptomyces sp. NPDC048290 TaxID=3155811 RepID=UPI0034201433